MDTLTLCQCSELRKVYLVHRDYNILPSLKLTEQRLSTGVYKCDLLNSYIN
jgi:hypothetical protein